MSKILINVRVEPDVNEKIKAVRDRLGVDLSEAVRYILNVGLDMMDVSDDPVKQYKEQDNG